MTQRARGFTLVELMAVTALLTIFTGAAAALSAHLFGSHRLSEAYTTDMLECQRVLDTMRRDVRSAASVETQPNVLWLSSPDHEVVYRLEDGKLTRSEDQQHRVVARGLAGLKTQVDNKLIHVRLELGTRVAHRKRRPASLATTMGMRTRPRR